jgi:sigma-B regulation protein RsbU (phosphoserine phosphatase)
MRFLADVRKFWNGLGRIGQVFLVALFVWLLLEQFQAASALRSVAQFVTLISGIVLAFRLIRLSIRKSIWRLRNRLLVAYLFVALVPLTLLILLGFAAAWAMSGQIAVYLVTAEFDRRLDLLERAGGNAMRSNFGTPADAITRIGAIFGERAPGVEIVITRNGTWHYPEQSRLEHPNVAWGNTRGVVAKDGELYSWIHLEEGARRLTIVAPLSREFLSTLVPDLGEVSVLSTQRDQKIRLSSKSSATTDDVLFPTGRVPAALNRFDLEVLWGSPIKVGKWESPGTTQDALFMVRSRISAVLKVLFSQKADWDNSTGLVLISALAILFLIVELIALLIGVSLSRSITKAVQNLYEGTERIMEGDFSHRITIQGNDQVAALSGSFNRMTENVERLLQVAKEKERYEAELSIAREVQAQLYPSSVPESQGLALLALYKPARSVSGDYFDYRRMGEHAIVLALGDVAGKGISAALLMATIQSAFRSRMTALSNSSLPDPAEVVAELNQHLYANTAAAKYATFFLGFFDEKQSVLTYTNAGHLEPILVRGGKATKLEVNGMVIGAFPFAKYDCSRLELQPGDLVVWYTDGITEPENEFGEMFGEERLIELLLKQGTRSDQDLLEDISAAVERWTGTPELQDDMTLLLARRV